MLLSRYLQALFIGFVTLTLVSAGTRQGRCWRRHDRDLAIDLRRDGRHLVAQSQVQREVGTETPIVLNISAVDLVAKILLAHGSRIERPSCGARLVGKKIDECAATVV